jgi:hypothetical protein
MVPDYPISTLVVECDEYCTSALIRDHSNSP